MVGRISRLAAQPLVNWAYQSCRYFWVATATALSSADLVGSLNRNPDCQ